MPAGFTHILLSKTFTENATFSDNIKNDLVNLLDGSLDFFQVGSIGPVLLPRGFEPSDRILKIQLLIFPKSMISLFFVSNLA